MAARAREEVMPAYPLPAQQAWRTSRFFLEAGLIFSEPRKHAGRRHNNQNNNERGSSYGVKAQSKWRACAANRNSCRFSESWASVARAQAGNVILKWTAKWTGKWTGK